MLKEGMDASRDAAKSDENKSIKDREVDSTKDLPVRKGHVGEYIPQIFLLA